MPEWTVEQCRAKAAELSEAAQRTNYLDSRRLYEELAEQWRSMADEIERGRRESPEGSDP
jgi:hypothetical protein